MGNQNINNNGSFILFRDFISTAEQLQNNTHSFYRDQFMSFRRRTECIVIA